MNSGTLTKKMVSIIIISIMVFIIGCGSETRVRDIPPRKDNYITNPGAENGKDELVSFWNKAIIEIEGLKLYRQTNDAHSGRAALAISNSHRYDKQVTNSWVQDIPNFPAGKSVRLSGYIQGEFAEKAFLAIECLGPNGSVLTRTSTDAIGFYNTGWVLVLSKAVTIPQETLVVRIRASLTGTGKAAFDDLKLAEFEPPIEPVVDDELKSLVDGEIVNVYPINKDSLIMAYLPQWCHGRANYTAISNCYGGARVLLNWPDISGEDLENSDYRFVVALYSYETAYQPPVGSMVIHKITEPWSELSSWQTRPEIAKGPVTKTEFTEGQGWKFFDVTALIRKQTKAGGENYGIEIRFIDERVPAWSGYKFVSRESKPEKVSLRPKLLVITGSGN